MTATQKAVLQFLMALHYQLTLTGREGIWIVCVVLVPETVSKLKVLELASDDAAKRGTQHSTRKCKFRDAGIEKVNVIHVTSKKVGQ